VSALPSGTVTFLFTDIEGSTRLREEGPGVMRAALARYEAIVREAVEGHDGFGVKTTGCRCGCYRKVPAKTCHASALFATRLNTRYTFSPYR